MNYLKLFYSLLFFISINVFSFAQSAEEYSKQSHEKFLEEKFDEALVLIDKAIAFDTSVVDYRIDKGKILFYQGEVALCVQEYYTVLTIDSTQHVAYNVLGNIFMEHNELDMSLFFFDKAIKHADADSTALVYYINRATSRGSLMDYQGAIKDLELAYKIDPTDYAILTNLPVFYTEVGRNDDAIELLKHAIEIYPEEIGPSMNLAFVYSGLDSLEQSKIFFEKSLQIDPNDPLVLNNIGFLYHQLGDNIKAIEYINRSLEIYEYNSYAYRNRALVHLSTEKNEEACEDLAKAREFEFHLRYGEEVNELIREHCEN